MFVTGHVDDGIEGDYGVEHAIGERYVGNICPNETGLGHLAAGHMKLLPGYINSRNPEVVS